MYFFFQVVEIYRTSDSGEERRQCLSALGKAKDPALLAEAMDYFLDSGEVSSYARTSTYVRTRTCVLFIPSVRRCCASPDRVVRFTCALLAAPVSWFGHM